MLMYIYTWPLSVRCDHEWNVQALGLNQASQKTSYQKHFEDTVNCLNYFCEIVTLCYSASRASEVIYTPGPHLLKY